MHPKNPTDYSTPERALSLAIAAEDARTHWLGEAADRFYSYDPEVSATLTGFFEASRAGLDALQLAYCRIFGDAMPISFLTVSARREFEARFVGESEFFILNDRCARKLLRRLSEYSRRVASHFRYAAVSTRDTALSYVLTATADRLEYQAARLAEVAKTFQRHLATYGAYRLQRQPVGMLRFG